MRTFAGVPMAVAPNDSEVVHIKTQANDLSYFLLFTCEMT